MAGARSSCSIAHNINKDLFLRKVLGQGRKDGGALDSLDPAGTEVPEVPIPDATQRRRGTLLMARLPYPELTDQSQGSQLLENVAISIA